MKMIPFAQTMRVPAGVLSGRGPAAFLGRGRRGKRKTAAKRRPGAAEAGKRTESGGRSEVRQAR